MKLTKPLNEYIDHTLLKPEAKQADYETFLDEAIKYQFVAVCIPSYMAIPVKQALTGIGSNIKVCAVVDFPLGHLPLSLKLSQAIPLAEAGIDEIDWVLNYANLRSGLFEEVGVEIENMGRELKKRGAVTKCIIETCYLNQNEIDFMWKALNERTEVDYIKTSTGFGEQGAWVGDVLRWNTFRQQEIAERKSDLIQLRLLDSRKTPLKIKAAGGIRDLETAFKFITCGADRLGMSASVKIMEEYNACQNNEIDI